MSFQHIQISRFGGPDEIELVEEPALPEPRDGEVRIRVLAAGTGYTDCFIRRGRYPDFKGPLPYTPGYDLIGTVDAVGPGVVAPKLGQLVADLCVVGGYTQYAVRPAASVVAVPEGLDPAEAVCMPLAYLTAYQMLTRLRPMKAGDIILVIGASGTVGTALLDLARHMGLRAIGTCSQANMQVVHGFGAEAVDYRAGDFVPAVRALTGGVGVAVAFDAIGGAHFARSFACLAPGGLVVGYGSQAMADGNEGLFSAGLGLVRLFVWRSLPFLFHGRRGVFYDITARRKKHPEAFMGDLTALFELLRVGAIHPVVVDRLPLSAARAVHERIDAGGLGGKIVLLPWT